MKGSPIQLPSPNEVNEALRVIEKRATQAQRHGEVLFIDERQLLTFGFIKGITLVPEYEKKYLMDQAMAGNEEYFETFYKDLANERFSMIVSEPLFTGEKDLAQTFGEENNAWVSWVADPILCYYSPARIVPGVRIELLTPRPNPKNCP